MTGEFQGGRFGFANRFQDFRENWAKMSSEEKIKFMDEKMEAMKSFKLWKGFMGRGFGHHFADKWEQMSKDEKTEFLNKRSECFDRGGEFKNFSAQNPQELIAAIDGRCEEWMKKSQEEKEAAVKERFEHLEEMRGGFGRFGGMGCRF